MVGNYPCRVTELEVVWLTYNDRASWCNAWKDGSRKGTLVKGNEQSAIQFRKSDGIESVSYGSDCLTAHMTSEESAMARCHNRVIQTPDV